MNTASSKKLDIFQLGETHLYVDAVLTFKEGEKYFETVTLLETGEVVLSAWTQSRSGIKEEWLQVFVPTERDKKLLAFDHGELKVGESHTIRKIHSLLPDCLGDVSDLYGKFPR